jgi:hypothetical protein
VVHERRLRMGMAVTSLTVSADESTMAVGYIDGTSEQRPSMRSSDSAAW